ncbi:unnamed protein product, partial [Amoebophrya sp. A25]
AIVNVQATLVPSRVECATTTSAKWLIIGNPPARIRTILVSLLSSKAREQTAKARTKGTERANSN